MKLIVAVDSQWGIGKNGDLLMSIPDDMRYFREMTKGAVLVMGYNTLLSFPGSKPLPGRLNIVLNDAADCKVCGAVVCDSLDQMFRLIAGFAPDSVFVIGGGSIYRQLLPFCDIAYITKMQFSGDADTFIPDLDELPEWSVRASSEEKDYEGLKYAFTEYRNAAPKMFGAVAEASQMPGYFMKKPPLAFDLLDTADKTYYKELQQLLHARFRPLEKGFSAGDVARFLRGSEAGKRSFEQYLRAERQIAAPEDLEKLRKKYDPDGTLRSYPMQLEKGQLDAFDEAVALPAPFAALCGLSR